MPGEIYGVTHKFRSGLRGLMQCVFVGFLSNIPAVARTEVTKDGVAPGSIGAISAQLMRKFLLI